MKTKLEEIQPFKLKKWIQSEEIRSKILDASEEGEIDKLCESVFEYADLIEVLDRNSFWYDIASLFSSIFAKNIPETIPILLSKEAEGMKLSWDYEGHSWFFWLHTFAKNYSWTEEYIAELDFNTAIALMQEIETEKQLEREWHWSLSEIAYPYIEATKKHEFRPLKRPDWMTIRVLDSQKDEPKKVKMPKSMLPVGNVISYADINSEQSN